MSRIILKNVIDMAIALIILDMLSFRVLEITEPYPSFRRLRYISKKLIGYR